MGDAPDPPQLGRRLQELAGSVSSFVAPITLISAILFYFGYVFTATQYGAFGLDVDTIGLSTQEFIMRSPGPLLFPLLAASLIAAVGGYAHAAIRRRIETATAEAPWRLRGIRRLPRSCLAAGSTGLGIGMAMVLSMAVLRPLLTLYDIVVPAVLAVGAALALYGLRLDRLFGRPRRVAATAALFVLLATSLLWMTATIAQYTGRYAAIQLGQGQDRPSVLLDTKERLYLPTATVREYALPDGAFRFRYTNLRLLIQGKDRMFLVPSPWQRGDPTLVVPMNDDVRVQFQR